MIQIDEKSLEGKPLNRHNENKQRIGLQNCENRFYHMENGRLNGWDLNCNPELMCWLDFHKNGRMIIEIYIDHKTHKIDEKTITI